jgi:phosphoadenosine phosphosulfate reductase
MNGIPDINSPLHEEFAYQVKLEPFKRVINDFSPQIWLTAIRKDQTSFRKNLDIVTQDEKGLIKVAPLFYTIAQELKNYLNENNLPDEQDYYDPTKVLKNRECGLHKST